MIGNLLPDMVPGPLNPKLHPDVLAGAYQHRQVDAFTDTHPVFARSRARLRDRHGRYSAILTDVFYDHILSRHWARYHQDPLPGFIKQAHAAMESHVHLMPDPMPTITERMIQQNWLGAYLTLDGMSRVLSMMSKRFSERLGRSVELTDAVDSLQDQREAFAEDFDEFFPLLISYMSAKDVVKSSADVTAEPIS